MRWRAKASPAEMPWWGWLLAPIWAPALALAMLAIGLLWTKRRLLGPTDEWRPWFAWHPVDVQVWSEGVWPEEERVWLEWVERRAGHFLGDPAYRTPLSSPEPRP